MTNREFYQYIIANVEDATIVEFAKTSLANLDARNARRNEQKATKRNAEYAPLEQNIVTFLEGKSNVTTSEIASALSLTTSKVSPRCKALVESGILVETDIKIPKVGLRKAYTLA